MYKYRIWRRDGSFRDHCDPYGFGMELRPQNASFIRDMESYRFHDSGWMKKRNDCKNGPLNIYELHAGSWKQKASGGRQTFGGRQTSGNRGLWKARTGGRAGIDTTSLRRS